MNREQSSDLTETVGIDLFPETERYPSEDLLKLTVHIKHDWYSEDSDHGRELLSSFMSVLSDPASKIGILLLSGSAVRMLEEGSPLHDDLLLLSNNSLLTGACMESLDKYGIDLQAKEELNITEYSSQDLFFEIINSERLITLE